MARTRRRPGSHQSTSASKPKPVKPTVRKCVIYARVSSQEQRTEGFSIEAQLELLRTYATREKLEVVEEFVDVETAKKAGRTEFTNLLQTVKKQKIDVVLCEKTDRLYRNISDWVTIDKLALEIHLVKENVVLTEDSRSHDKFIHGIKVLMAKNYIDNLAEETAKGMRQKARQGWWPHAAPLGYLNQRGPDGKNIIVVDPERGPMVAQMFELYAGGEVSLLELKRRFQTLGLRTKKGNIVSKSTVHYILQNPIYMGQFCWKGDWHKGKHQPIIPGTLWDQVQDLLDERSKSARSGAARLFTFSGVILCGVCAEEGVRRVLTGEEKKKQYVYYSCARCRDLDRPKYHSERKLERRVLTELRKLHIPQEVMRLVADALRGSVVDAGANSDRERDSAHQQAQELRRKIRTAFDDRLAGRLPVAVYTDLVEGWQIEVEQLENRMAACSKADATLMDLGITLLELATTAADTWKSLSDRERREMLVAATHNSLSWPDRLEIRWRKPFVYLAESASDTDAEKAASLAENGLSGKWLPLLDSNQRHSD